MTDEPIPTVGTTLRTPDGREWLVPLGWKVNVRVTNARSDGGEVYDVTLSPPPHTGDE